MEFRMLSTDYPLILLTIFMQWFHSVITNIAYWQHAQLSAANRVPLKDFAFEMLPLLDGKMWIISEYIFCIILGVAISCIVSNLFVKWNAPHGRPIYCVQILRRLGMTLICCLILRMISFLVFTDLFLKLCRASRFCDMKNRYLRKYFNYYYIFFENSNTCSRPKATKSFFFPSGVPQSKNFEYICHDLRLNFLKLI